MSSYSPRLVWFPRAADIPSFDFTPWVEVPQADAELRAAAPEVVDESTDWYTAEPYLLWPGDSRRSPALCAADAFPALTPYWRIAAALSNALELPGTPQDYVAVIGAATGVGGWRARTVQPETIEWLEPLCWLRIRLATACLDGGLVDHDSREWNSVLYAYLMIADLQTGEGFVADALDVLAAAAAWPDPRDEIRQRRDRLLALGDLHPAA